MISGCSYANYDFKLKFCACSRTFLFLLFSRSSLLVNFYISFLAFSLLNLRISTILSSSIIWFLGNSLGMNSFYRALLRAILNLRAFGVHFAIYRFKNLTSCGQGFAATSLISFGSSGPLSESVERHKADSSSRLMALSLSALNSLSNLS